jgi:hypothetical protein
VQLGIPHRPLSRPSHAVVRLDIFHPPIRRPASTWTLDSLVNARRRDVSLPELRRCWPTACFGLHLLQAAVAVLGPPLSTFPEDPSCVVVSITTDPDITVR